MGRQGLVRTGWVNSSGRAAYVVMVAGAVWVLALALGLLGPLTDDAFLILGAGAVAARLAFSTGKRRPFSYGLLLGAGAAVLVGDVVYMLVETHVLTLPQRVFDVPYALAFVLFIGTVLHPSMRELTEPLSADELT